jgi:hypothetical protein
MSVKPHIMLIDATPRPWRMQGQQGENQIVGAGPIVDSWCQGPPILDVSAWKPFPTQADIDLILFAVNNIDRLLRVEHAAKAMLRSEDLKDEIDNLRAALEGR